MTPEEIEKLSDMIASNVLDNLHFQFSNDPNMNVTLETTEFMHKDLDEFGNAKYTHVDESEIVQVEIQRLNNLLSRYVDNEEYEKALIIKRKIEIIQKRYKL